MAGPTSRRIRKLSCEMLSSARLATASLCVLLLASTSTADIDRAFCNLQPSSNVLPFPHLDTTYQAKVELIQYDLKRTVFIEEYYSNNDESKLGAMIITGYFGPGVRTQFINDARTQELFTIYDVDNTYDIKDNCKVDPLTGDIFSFPTYDHDKFTATSDDFMSSGSILFMGAASNDTYYNGSQRVEGIYVDVWKSCLYQSATDTTVLATYYFAQKDSQGTWTPASGDVSAPVRIDIDSGPKTTPSFRRTFNYAYYSAILSLDDREIISIFETPEGAMCNGRKNSKDLPNVPQWFSFRMETVDPNTRIVMTTREWYDSSANYTRIDFRVPPTGDSAVNYPTKIISDYNTGVSYTINKDKGTCTISGIAGDSFDNTVDPMGNVRMRSPKEFFDFDQTSKWPYQYEGVHLARGILSDTWISLRPFPTEDAGDGYQATWEWYFSTDTWTIKANTMTEVLEPVRAVITLPNGNYKIIYNIYKFVEEEPDASIFDVSACYLSAGSRAYEVSFTADVDKYELATNRKILNYWILSSVQAVTGVSSLRVQELEVTFGTHHFATRFLLLGAAPNVTTGVTQVSLQDAGTLLENSILSGQFYVNYFFNGTLVQFPAVVDSLRVIRHRQRSRYVNGTGDALHYPSSDITDGGIFALLVIGTASVGVILAFAAVWVDRRRRATSHVAYQRQGLTMDHVIDDRP